VLCRVSYRNYHLGDDWSASTQLHQLGSLGINSAGRLSGPSSTRSQDSGQPSLKVPNLDEYGGPLGARRNALGSFKEIGEQIDVGAVRHFDRGVTHFTLFLTFSSGGNGFAKGGLDDTWAS
jgi:hypothetical protein